MSEAKTSSWVALPGLQQTLVCYIERFSPMGYKPMPPLGYQEVLFRRIATKQLYRYFAAKSSCKRKDL